MQTSSSAPLPVEVTRKIRQALFLGREDGPPPVPATFGGRVAWAGGILVHWFLLILALINLAWVIFDFSYLSLRPHYLVYTPHLATMYDPVKGVSPHRTTQMYIQRADLALRRVAAGDLGPGTRDLLREMRERSAALYQEDPFSGAGLAGLFEQAKNRMRRHMGLESGKQALMAFWTEKHLTTPERAAAEAAFFNRDIRPLLHRNYYRAVGEDGQPFNAFWLIDLCFVPFFAAEFLLRGIAVVAHHPRYPSWKAYAYARWYDLIYFVPLVQYMVPFGQSGWIHLLRVFSVGRRMQRLGLVNPVETPQQVAAQVLDLVTDLVSVRLLSNYQDSVRRFDLGQFVGGLSAEQQAEVAAFFELHAAAFVRDVLPELNAEIKALALFSAQNVLAGSPTYRRLRRIPFVGDWPERHLDELVAEIVDGMQDALQGAVGSAEHRRLIETLSKKAGRLLIAELQALESEATVKGLIVDLLEEQKQRLLA
ncbi:MAG: hypothetical protein FJZ01_20950 [Candidatus Sericytochromatia bacterium]|nr:hypothetical protein [Candidatus Tanganyikabacteria bacterium]